MLAKDRLSCDPYLGSRRVRVAAAAAFLISVGSPLMAQERAIADLVQGIRWGETQDELLAHFGARATVLQRPIDFGDSYARIVLRDTTLGGVALITFFQIDKETHGLKRIQVERQRHGVNPPAVRGVVGGLKAELGVPGTVCAIPPGPTNGYQAAGELLWSRGTNVVRAVFRDTTIEAIEGCLWRDLSGGPCGLTGQLFVRISPSSADVSGCAAAHP